MSTIDILPHGREKCNLQGTSGALVTHFLSFLEMEVGGLSGSEVNAKYLSVLMLCYVF